MLSKVIELEKPVPSPDKVTRGDVVSSLILRELQHRNDEVSSHADALAC